MSSARPPLTRADRSACLAVAAAGVAFFLFALRTGFSADDYFILARLQARGGLAHSGVYFTQTFFQYYRPLAFVSHAVDWQLWGLNAAGYHLTSLLLHGLNAALVFLLARRLTTRTGAVVAGLLFATHPAAHEAVYWMSARFDLLATCFSLLAVLWLTDGRRSRVWLGLGAFGLAVLSKESALAVPVLVAAYDVLIDRRSWRDAAVRLLPLLLVMAAYGGARAIAAEGPSDDARRLPKLVALGVSMAGVLAYARVRAARLGFSAAGERLVRAALVVAVAAMAMLLWLPLTSMWAARRLGFVAYAVFYLVSPVILPTPPGTVFTPVQTSDGAIGLLVLAVVAAVVWLGRRWLSREPVAVYATVFTTAALIPVLSLTGSPRYVYLATAGLCLLVGHACANILTLKFGQPRTRPVAVVVALVAYLAISSQQVAMAGSAWRWGSAMVAKGISLMSRDLEPCGTKDVLMVTTPVGIRDVYSNFYWDMFQVAGCTPASFSALLRVERVDAHVEVHRLGPHVLELRVRDYPGTFVGSADLRHFDVSIEAGASLEIATPDGDITTHAEGAEQVFVVKLSEVGERAALFYYSDGAVRAVPEN